MCEAVVVVEKKNVSVPQATHMSNLAAMDPPEVAGLVCEGNDIIGLGSRHWLHADQIIAGKGGIERAVFAEISWTDKKVNKFNVNILFLRTDYFSHTFFQ